MRVLDSVEVLELASAFVSQGDRVNPCLADKVELHGTECVISYSWARGSSDWHVHLLELVAWGWCNPRAPVV